MQKVLVICGPTSTGKTSLALKIAKLLGSASIISADSRQVYTDIDIVSGKDTPSDLPSSIRFFGLSLFKPNEVSNLSDYVNYARKIITEELEKKHNVIIVGGTGLYLKGITLDLTDIFIPNDPELREELSVSSMEELQKKLKALAPEKFGLMNNSDKHNSRRLIRAIEVASNLLPVKNTVPVPSAVFEWVGLSPKEDLHKLIKQRVIDRLEQGVLDEVKNLLAKYPDTKLPVFSSLGVGEIIDFLKRKITKDELIDLWTRSEENYAKRQIVWFKKQPEIIWYDESINRDELAKKLVLKFK